MAMLEVTTEDFAAQVLNAEGVVVVDIWATWCGPCRQLSPILDKFSEDFADKAAWFKLDADANPATVQEFGVTSIPTVLVFKAGEVVHSVIGAKPMAVLREELSKFF